MLNFIQLRLTELEYANYNIIIQIYYMILVEKNE